MYSIERINKVLEVSPDKFYFSEGLINNWNGENIKIFKRVPINRNWKCYHMNYMSKKYYACYKKVNRNPNKIQIIDEYIKTDKLVHIIEKKLNSCNYVMIDLFIYRYIFTFHLIKVKDDNSQNNISNNILIVYINDLEIFQTKHDTIKIINNFDSTSFFNFFDTPSVDTFTILKKTMPLFEIIENTFFHEDVNFMIKIWWNSIDTLLNIGIHNIVKLHDSEELKTEVSDDIYKKIIKHKSIRNRKTITSENDYCYPNMN
jgi:hypothetical protein